MKAKLVIESAWDVISLLSAEGHVLCASPSTSRVFGYFPEEVVGRRAIDLVHPDDRPRVRRALAAVLIHPPDPRRVEMRVLQQDGEWGRVDAAIFNLLYEPCIGGILVNCRKIRSRKTAKSNRRYLVAEKVNTRRPPEDFACAEANDLRELPERSRCSPNC
jgi:PAS domain S-box-containing protein